MSQIVREWDGELCPIDAAYQFWVFPVIFYSKLKMSPNAPLFFDVSIFRLVFRKFLFEFESFKMKTINFTHLSNEILELHGGH